MNEESGSLCHHCLSFLVHTFHILFTSLPFLQYRPGLLLLIARHLEDQLSNMAAMASGQTTNAPLTTITNMFYLHQCAS